MALINCLSVSILKRNICKTSDQNLNFGWWEPESGQFNKSLWAGVRGASQLMTLAYEIQFVSQIYILCDLWILIKVQHRKSMFKK